MSGPAMSTERPAVALIDPAELGRQADDGRAVAELRSFLRRGLARALQGWALQDGDLDDFTQDAVIRIIEKRDTFRGDSRFTTWAMAVAIRVALGTLRRRRYRDRRHRHDPASIGRATVSSAGAPDPSRLVERRSLIEVLRGAIRLELTERQRQAVLGELDGVPSLVLAERLGIERNALYKLQHDAREKLRAAIVAAGFDQSDVRERFLGTSKESPR